MISKAEACISGDAVRGMPGLSDTMAALCTSERRG